MSIPDKQIVLKTVGEEYDCILSNVKRKQIMYQGVSAERNLFFVHHHQSCILKGKDGLILQLNRLKY